MISAVTTDIYMQPSVKDMMPNYKSIMRLMFLIFEFTCFVMIVIGNFLFLSMRMCRPNQLNIVRLEPKR